MLLINKPVGKTSFDIVREVRRKTGVKKVGHAGTLDPLAEGLLIIFVGKDETKNAQKFIGLDKEYETVARIGYSTETGDLEGEIIDKKECQLSKEEVENALNTLLGEHDWQVPIYSAIKVNGKPLYKYARENKKVELPIKHMSIKKIKLINVKQKDGYCDVKYMAIVSSGTYIRVLNQKLGELLNCPATTAHIKRTRIGDFSLDNAVNIEDL